MTIKKVIIVVLLIMFVVPLFDTDNYLDAANSWDYTVINIHTLLKNKKVSLDVLNIMINKRMSTSMAEETNLIYFSTPFNELPTYVHEDFLNVRLVDWISST
jgi:hypothetical protein